MGGEIMKETMNWLMLLMILSVLAYDLFSAFTN